MNSFNKTEAAIIPMQTMLFFDYLCPCFVAGSTVFFSNTNFVSTSVSEGQYVALKALLFYIILL